MVKAWFTCAVLLGIMSEEKPIRPAEIARHWNVSPPYLSKLRSKKGMPDFFTFEQADAWRALNAPPKAALETTRQNPAPVAGKNIADQKAPQPPEGIEAQVVDIRAFVEAGGDFDAIMIRHAEEVPQIAYGLYKLACASNRPDAVRNATANWSDAAKAAAAVREKFLEIQEKSRALIPLDVVMDILGTELQAVRTLLLKLGTLYGTKANPQNPTLAAGVIDEAVNEVFRRFGQSEERVDRELRAG